MNVPRGRFMVIPDGVMSSAWQSWTLRTDQLLHGEHGGHPFRLSAIRSRATPIGAHGFILRRPFEQRKKSTICAHLRGWASSMMKFGISSTTG